MAIQLRVATSMDVLSAEIIADLHKEHPVIGVFEKQWIITQTDGINSWLKQHIATSSGIAANMQFIKMNDIVQLLYYRLCPGAFYVMDKDQMTWTIFAELNTAEFCQQFPSIAVYYKNNQPRRAALAAEMADIFDQYQVYRHDQIEKWNKEESIDESDLNWQVFLWRRMKERISADYADKLDVSRQLLSKLQDPQSAELVCKLLPSLRFFGLAIVTPYYLELFRTLSRIIDVKFYLLNPCPEELWMEDFSDRKIAKLRKRPDLLEHRKAGNDLLLNWGTVLRESYLLLLEHDDYVNSYEVVPSSQGTCQPVTLLEHIQYEIHHNISNAERTAYPAEILYDDSLQINGCFTPVREVEVLYNYLLDQFSKDPSLGARDIVVMVNDIDAYASYIRAIFDNAPVTIPYSIADESVSGGNTLFTAIRDILLLDAVHFKAEEVLALLESPYIKRRFGFNDIGEVRRAVQEAGIFFGVGTSTTDDSLYESTEAWMVSWEYGLQKIMYGLCMSGEPAYDGGTRPLYPLDTAEGADMSDRIRLYHFIQVLVRLMNERKGEKTLSQWSDYMGDIMSQMILEEEDDDEDFPRFAQLKECITEMDAFSDGATISYQTFKQIFMSRLEQERRSNRYAGKGVNFCTMVPMRSVPYKIVAMLGMNFDQFPRQDSVLSFSLMGRGKKRPGDRSVRENDKHLFLETILAARSKLYISYLARDVQKGSELPPSSLVDEMLDYIALKADPDFKKQKICIHPLHLFSAKYRDEALCLPANYLGNSLVEGTGFRQSEALATEIVETTASSLDDLSVFFKNPVKYYFNKRLGIYYYEEGEELMDTERFELDTLENWGIKDGLLNTPLSYQSFKDHAKKSGRLPLANMGELSFRKLEAQTHPFKKELDRLRNGEELRRIPIHLRLDNTVIEGYLPIYGNRYIIATVSGNILKHAIGAWINFIAAIAQEDCPPIELSLLYKYANKPLVLSLSSAQISTTEARVLMSQFINTYQQGQERILSFHPNLVPFFYQKDVDGIPIREITADLLLMEYQKETNNAFSFSRNFSDGGYLEQFAQNADPEINLFAPGVVAELNKTIPDLLDLLYNHCPEIFK
jgi:exodeoxyribonuclease V gamma subunit